MSHMLRFCLSNPYVLDRDGPLAVFYRAVTIPLPSVHTLDLSEYAGQTVLITGATSGCGLECAQALSRQGCHLILTSRTLARGEDVKSDILSDPTSSANTTIDVVELDLTSLDSIKTFAPRLRHHTAHLDVAILNAGVYQTSLRICVSTGWEETTQVNFTATAALTLHLRPFLTAAATKPRLLLIASEVHAWIRPRHSSTTELLHNMHAYTNYERYHISKLLLVLWSRDLAQRSEWRDVAVAAASPGYCQTPLWRNSELWLLDGLVNLFARTSEQGASAYLLALGDMLHKPGVENRGGFSADGVWRAPSTASCCVEARGLQKSLRSDVLAMLSEVGLGEDLAE